jgi:hypothetical protein
MTPPFYGAFIDKNISLIAPVHSPPLKIFELLAKFVLNRLQRQAIVTDQQ